MEANLKKMGSEFAHAEDAVKACLRLAADDSINGMSNQDESPWLTTPGRALGIVPRNVEKEGYVDLALDDMDRDDLKWMYGSSKYEVDSDSIS